MFEASVSRNAGVVDDLRAARIAPFFISSREKIAKNWCDTLRHNASDVQHVLLEDDLNAQATFFGNGACLFGNDQGGLREDQHATALQRR